MIEKIEELTSENPVGVLIVANGLLLTTFVASVYLYKEAKNEGLSRMLGVLQILGI